MHAVYNYCGFVDMYEALNKLEGAGVASRSLEDNVSPVTAKHARDSGSSHSAPVKADKR
jgi:hypothetical protein